MSAPESFSYNTAIVAAAEEKKREDEIAFCVVESKAVEEGEEDPVAVAVGNRFVTIPAVPVDKVNRPPMVVPVPVKPEGGHQVADIIMSRGERWSDLGLRELTSKR